MKPPVEVPISAQITRPFTSIAKSPQRRFQFQAAAADVARLRADFDARIRRHELTGFVASLAVDQNFARHDQRLSLFARFGESVFDQRAIESVLSRRQLAFTTCAARLDRRSRARRRAPSPKGCSASCARQHCSCAISRDASRP